MTEMSGAPDLAFDQATVDEHRATNTSPQSQQNNVAKTFRRALPNLAEQRGVCIVQHHHRRFQKTLPHESLETTESPLHVRDRATITRRESRRRETDVTRRFAALVPNQYELIFDRLRPRTFCVGSITRQIIEHVAISGNDDDFDISAAEVDAD